MISLHNPQSLSSQHSTFFTHLQRPNLFHIFNKFSSKTWVYHVTFHTQSPSSDEKLSSSSSSESKRENDIALQLLELKKLFEVLKFTSHEEEEQLTEFLGPKYSLCKRKSTSTSIKLQFSCERRRHKSIWGKNQGSQELKVKRKELEEIVS